MFIVLAASLPACQPPAAEEQAPQAAAAPASDTAAAAISKVAGSQKPKSQLLNMRPLKGR